MGGKEVKKGLEEKENVIDSEEKVKPVKTEIQCFLHASRSVLLYDVHIGIYWLDSESGLEIDMML